jgi:hypothetical protein
MIQVSRLVFTIQHSDGHVEELSVDSDRALVGSGAYCEIRLPRDQAAHEVLAVEERGGGLFVEVRAFNPPPRLNGLEFSGGKLLEGAVLQVGQCRITAKLLLTTADEAGNRRKDGASGNLGTVGALLLLCGAASMYMFAPTPNNELPAAPPAPKLWAEGQKAEQCPQRTMGPAAAMASEQLLTAEGRRERAPFFFQDGVAAVSSFDKAAACFAVAGDQIGAKEAAHSATSLREKLKSEFHIHQVRLERALATQAYDAARREAKILQTFFQGRKEEYVTWLASLDRTLELKFSGKKEP